MERLLHRIGAKGEHIANGCTGLADGWLLKDRSPSAAELQHVARTADLHHRHTESTASMTRGPAWPGPEGGAHGSKAPHAHRRLAWGAGRALPAAVATAVSAPIT